MKIPVNQIDATQAGNKSRPEFAPSECESLAALISKYGLINPIAVVPIEHETFKYKIVDGFRRYTAVAVVLGQEEIECNVMEASQHDDVRNLIANLERKNLSYWEECTALRKIFPEGTSESDVARMLHKSRSWVRCRLKVWQLSPGVILDIERGDLSAADIAVIIQASPEEQVAAAEKIKQAKQSGKTRKEIANTMTRQRNMPNKKELLRALTIAMQEERDDAIAALRFATGEWTLDDLKDSWDTPECRS